METGRKATLTAHVHVVIIMLVLLSVCLYRDSV